MPEEKIQVHSWTRGLIGQEYLQVYPQRRCWFWKVHFIKTRQLKLWHVPESS